MTEINNNRRYRCNTIFFNNRTSDSKRSIDVADDRIAVVLTAAALAVPKLSFKYTEKK